MTATDLDSLIATTQDQAARQLAGHITARMNDLREPLLNRLERIWQTDPAQFLPDDRLILGALTHFSNDLHMELYHRAYDSARYAAARCITHYRLPGRLGGGQ